MLDVVGARTQLKKSGARYTGRCPFHEERTPSFSVNAARQALLLLRLRQGRRPHLVRPRDGEPRLRRRDRVARQSASASRSSTRSRARPRTPHASGASGCTPCSSRRRSFYERYLWDSDDGRARRGSTSPGADSARTVCKEFRLGLSPVSPELARKAAEKGFSRGPSWLRRVSPTGAATTTSAGG